MSEAQERMARAICRAWFLRGVVTTEEKIQKHVDEHWRAHVDSAAAALACARELVEENVPVMTAEDEHDEFECGEEYGHNAARAAALGALT